MAHLEITTDPLTRTPVIIVPARQGRPNLRADDACPFCPGGLEAPEGHYDVKWFPNRWPPMPDDRCEMILYTPEHDLAFWQLGTEGVLRVIDLWTDRTRVLSGRDDVEYVLIFENRGAAVGATIPHPHGQIYAFAEVPPQPLLELTDGVIEAPGSTDPLVVCSHGDWTAWVPQAPTWPFELVVATTDDVTRLTCAGIDREGLAEVLIDVLVRLEQFAEGLMPYMMWIHQEPFSDEVFAPQPLHIHIAPYLRAPGVPRYVASAELGGGIYFDPVAPSAAAATLRDQPGPAHPEATRMTAPR